MRCELSPPFLVLGPEFSWKFFFFAVSKRWFLPALGSCIWKFNDYKWVWTMSEFWSLHSLMSLIYLIFIIILLCHYNCWVSTTFENISKCISEWTTSSQHWFGVRKAQGNSGPEMNFLSTPAFGNSCSPNTRQRRWVSAGHRMLKGICP